MRTSRLSVLLGCLLAACQATLPAEDSAPGRDSQQSALSVREGTVTSAARAKPVDPGPIDPGPVSPPSHRAAVQPVAAPALMGATKDPALLYATLLNPPATFTNREVLGVVPGSDACPAENADWKGGDVFGATQVRSIDGFRFCAYQWSAVGQPNLATLPRYCPSGKNCQPCPANWTCEAAPPGHLWLEASHAGLFAMGLPAEARSVIGAQITKQHALAVGAPAQMPSGSVTNPNSWWFPYALPSWFTKVYVLDDGGVHGATVANWIRQTACPTGTGCPWIERRDVFEGDSQAGSVLTLARAIVAAVDESSGSNPILNLSVGFHWRHAWTGQPNYNDDVAGANIRFAHQALESALNYAGCKGALVVAAAGNRDGGAQAEDPGPRYFGGSTAYPAAFSAINQGWGCNAGTPLVVPVGAIRADGASSPSARDFGRSCMSAPSTALTPDGDPLEGSSFAAATFTGVLANARGYMPGATRAEVMRAVSSQMQTLPGAPLHKVCYGHRSSMARVHQCKTIKRALEVTCQKSGSGAIASQYSFACGLAAQLSCTSIGVVPHRLSLDAAAADTLTRCVEDPARKHEPDFYPSSAVPLGTQCNVDTVYAQEAERNTYSCPSTRFDNGQTTPDRLVTSPGDPGCGCSLYLTANRSLWLVGSLLNTSITSPALRVKLTAGGSNVAYITPQLPTSELYELGSSVDESSGSGLSILLTDQLPTGYRVDEAEFSFITADGTTPQAFSAALPILEEAP